MAEAVDKARLFELLEPALAAMGFELADIDAHFGRRGLLRLFIDREGGVTIEDCQRVSEQIGKEYALRNVIPLPASASMFGALTARRSSQFMSSSTRTSTSGSTVEVVSTWRGPGMIGGAVMDWNERSATVGRKRPLKSNTSRIACVVRR